VFSNPLKNLKAFGLKDDDVVADLGAGTGHYSLVAGEIVTRGKVYAVELQKDFLTMLRSRATDARLKNIELIWGNVEKKGGTKIADSVVDAVIASNILFQVEDKENFIEEIKRILKPKGRVLFVDWSPSSIMKTTAIISPDRALGLFTKKDFILQRNIDAGEHHYGMILIKS